MRPQYAEGPLVRVATARHQAEAEMLRGCCSRRASPLTRRSGGFDVPDFLASGPRDILVPGIGSRPRLGAARRPGAAALPSPVRVRAWGQGDGGRLAVGIAALIAAGVFAAVF